VNTSRVRPSGMRCIGPAARGRARQMTCGRRCPEDRSERKRRTEICGWPPCLWMTG
jgi:hypothetical protein